MERQRKFGIQIQFYLSWSVGVMIIKYHRLVGLNNAHLFLIFLEAGKSKIEALADLVPGSQMAIFSLYLHMVKRTREFSGPLL